VLVHNHLRCTRHSLEFRLEEHLGLVSGYIRLWIKKAFDCLMLCNARHKVERELDVELYGMDDDRELMARRNARHEALRMAKLTVRCREFTRRFTRHRSIVLMSSLY
jgi:hypothetical protein